MVLSTKPFEPATAAEKCNFWARELIPSQEIGQPFGLSKKNKVYA
jgi:hypothetical protein